MWSALQRLAHQMTMLIGRGETKVVDDTGVVQKVQVFMGPLETRDETPRIGDYGLAYNPPDDTDCVVIFIGGHRDNGVVIGTNNKSARLKNLAKGEVALHDDQGRWIWIKRDSIEIEAGNKDVFVKNATNVNVKATTKITLDAPTVECTGNLNVTGTVTGTVDVIGGGTALETHTHTGVTVGGGTSGPPT